MAKTRQVDLVQEILDAALDKLFEAKWVNWAPRFPRNSSGSEIRKESIEAQKLYKEYMKP